MTLYSPSLRFISSGSWRASKAYWRLFKFWSVTEQFSFLEQLPLRYACYPEGLKRNRDVWGISTLLPFQGIFNNCKFHTQSRKGRNEVVGLFLSTYFSSASSKACFLFESCFSRQVRFASGLKQSLMKSAGNPLIARYNRKLFG